ncbi:hypothetical protein B296_00035306 [Ensete ventricosum]|uniref:Uncharacterized protein n=1 Tax=Ensete ventricosum TaxID=4639 RepID=A0A426XGJ5_ENSVE|nr:hypothetical protein B296_00035306 [Ensete ventricosum]
MEASGDSEAASDPVAEDNDDDDMESCCCTDDDDDAARASWCFSEGESTDHDCGHEGEEDKDEDGGGGDAGAPAEDHSALTRSLSGAEEEERVVDPGEENRLFWETCLASGYP